MSKERLIISQLINKISGLDEDARRQLVEQAIRQGVINEVSASTLMRTLRVIEAKETPKSRPDFEKS